MIGRCLVDTSRQARREVREVNLSLAKRCLGRSRFFNPGWWQALMFVRPVWWSRMSRAEKDELVGTSFVMLLVLVVLALYVMWRW